MVDIGWCVGGDDILLGLWMRSFECGDVSFVSVSLKRSLRLVCLCPRDCRRLKSNLLIC